MGVSPVPGYGQITQSNAAQIYGDKETYDNLDVAQKHLIDRYVTPEEKDEIDYGNIDNSKKNGRDSIEDAEKADSHGGQTGNAIATGGGAVACAAGAVALLKMPIYTNVIGAMAGAIGMAVLSALSLVCVNQYDNAYKDRTTARDNADGTNEIIDAHAAAMEDTMDMMNEDMELYQEQNDEMTNGMNEKAAQLADLKQQLADCEAAGDAAGASGIKNQMKKINEEDFAEDQEGLDETKEKLEGYQEANGEALGVADGGTTVSDFLKVGTGLGVGGAIVSTLLGVATIICGLDAAKAASSFKTFWEIPPALIACAMLLVSASLLGVATNSMRDKTTNEFECGAAGGEMSNHVNDLNTMIGQQQQYIESTGENYDESDEKAGEDREKGQEAADKLAPEGSKNPNGTDKDKDKDDDKNGNSQPSVVM